MSGKSKIQWTDATWNPVTGCTKVSEGCRNCWACRLAATRLKHNPRYEGLATIHNGLSEWSGQVRLHSDLLDLPLHWRKPRKIFVCPQADLFHDVVPFEFIKRVWDVAAQRLDHTFQILTKRAERMLEFGRWMAGADDLSIAEWPRNCWLGVSVEDQKTADERIPVLLQTPAAIRFVSYEPALGPVKFNERWFRYQSAGGYHFEDAIDWVIAGGESGPHARPTHPDWFRSARDQCQAAGVPFFFKQWGEWLAATILNAPGNPEGDFRRGDAWVSRVGKKRAGRLLDGREWNEFPETR
jgi:protein gp37